MTSSRKLSVILAADAVGYSRLSEKDEKAALAAVGWFRERADEIIAAHEGRVFFRAGDGAMAEFANVRAGVLAALELAETVRARVAHGDRPALPVRIGLHLGDVAAETDGDRLGHDVNVAARIQQIANPGEVLASRALVDIARGKVGARFERVGPERLKNLEEPVEVYRVVADVTVRRSSPVPLIAGAAASIVSLGIVGLGWLMLRETEGASSPAAAPVTTEAAADAAPSIAVLPFVNMSSDPEQEYFSDGLSEELLNQLVQIDGLRVVARTSSFAFKGQNIDMREVGRTLDVSHLLEGSVRKSGDTLRIVAQLINVSDGSHIWSYTYDRRLEDVFAVQEEIANAVADELSLTLGLTPPTEDYGGTASLEAYDHYLRGRALTSRFNPEDLQRGLEEFQSALAIDPSYGLAWAGVAETAQALTIFQGARAAELSAMQSDAVARGLAADPGVWQLHAQSAQVFWGRREWTGAERAWAEAERLAPPGSPELAFQYGGYFLPHVGRAQETRDTILVARAADPLAPLVSSGTAWGLQLAGDLDAASQEHERCLTIPGCSGAAFQELMLRLHVGDRAAIEAHLENYYPAIAPGEQEFIERFRSVWDSPDDAVALVREVVSDPAVAGPDVLAAYAMLPAHYGYAKLALDMLREDYFERGGRFTVFLWMPQMAEVRRTPEFKQLVRDLGLYDYWRESGHWGDFCRPLGADDFECL